MTAWPAIAEPFSVEALERACPELMAALRARAEATVIAAERQRIREAMRIGVQWPRLSATVERIVFDQGGSPGDLAMALLDDMRRARFAVQAVVDAGVRHAIPDDERKTE